MDTCERVVCVSYLMTERSTGLLPFDIKVRRFHGAALDGVNLMSVWLDRRSSSNSVKLFLAGLRLNTIP